jgi:hypothetical protein
MNSMAGKLRGIDRRELIEIGDWWGPEQCCRKIEHNYELNLIKQFENSFFLQYVFFSIIFVQPQNIQI